MTNNLKILTLTILSIFIFILTGYFYFSSPSVKNQIIANNNDEKKDDKEIIDINNKDNNKKDNEEKTSKLSILKIIIIVILILIIIIGVIVFIIVNKFKFEFNKESKEDFAKENFCSNFFTIHISKMIKKSEEKGIKIYNVKEDANYFFEILASFLLPKNKIDKVEISLSSENREFCYVQCGYAEFKYIISLKDILDEINEFAPCPRELDDNKIDLFIKLLKNNNDDKSKIINSKEMKKKYGKEFDSYLCAYLLYHLFETIGNRRIKAEISDPKKKKKDDIITEYFYASSDVPFDTSYIFFDTNYRINYDIIDEILKRLLNDNPLQNVSFS